MAALDQVVFQCTESEYLDGESTSHIKHEYVNGHVYAMSGGSAAHSLIVLNLASLLLQHLRQSPCRVFNSEMKLRGQTAQDTRFYYPDIQVGCDTTDTANAKQFLTQPLLVVEVLSESTERLERFEKFAIYQQIATLQEYLLVAQDRQKVEVFRRSDDWHQEKYLHDTEIILRSVKYTVLPIAAIYDKVGL